MSKEFKRMQQLAGVKEIQVSPPKTYYAVINHRQINHRHEPFHIITHSKELMINTLNKAYKELTGENYIPYKLDDLDEEARGYYNTYISDDWATVTDDKTEFNYQMGLYNPPPKRYQSPTDVNEIVTRGPTQIYKSIPDQGLYKIKNFPQGDAYNPKVKEILDKIAQDAYGEIPTPGSIDYEEYLDSINYHMTITLQSRANVYVYISDDGMEPSIYDSLEYFSDGYKTEEEWGVEDWEQI